MRRQLQTLSTETPAACSSPDTRVTTVSRNPMSRTGAPFEALSDLPCLFSGVLRRGLGHWLVDGRRQSRSSPATNPSVCLPLRSLQPKKVRVASRETATQTRQLCARYSSPYSGGAAY